MRTVPPFVSASHPMELPVAAVLVSGPEIRSSELGATNQYFPANAGPVTTGNAKTFVPAELVQNAGDPPLIVSALPLKTKPPLSNETRPTASPATSLELFWRFAAAKVR